MMMSKECLDGVRHENGVGRGGAGRGEVGQMQCSRGRRLAK